MTADGTAASRRLRYVALDLDGTTLSDRKRIEEANVSVLRALHAAGMTIVLASGRMTPSVLIHETALEIDCHLVTYNGAHSSLQRAQGRRKVFHRPLPVSIADKVLEWAKARNTCLNVYVDDVLYTVQNPAHEWQIDSYEKLAQVKYKFVDDLLAFKGSRPTKLIAMLDREDEAAVEALRAELAELLGGPEHVHLVKAEYFVEILDAGVNKGDGLLGLLRSIDASPDEVVAFGDGQNDVEFLTCVGYGVAVANAHPLAKQAARHVSPYTNNEDAIANELLRLWRQGLLDVTSAPEQLLDAALLQQLGA